MKHFWVPVIHPLCEALPIIRKAPSSAAIVEIGAEFGHNTRNLAAFAKDHSCTLDVVDPVKHFDLTEISDNYEKATMHVALSLDSIPLLNRIDIIFIDGDHNWHTIINELRLIEQHCKKNDLPFPIAFCHDMGWPYARRDLYYSPELIPEADRHPYRQAGMQPGQSNLIENGGLNPTLFNATKEGTPRNGVLTAVEDFLEETELDLHFQTFPVFHGLGILCPKSLTKDAVFSKALAEVTPKESSSQLLEEAEKERIAALIQRNELRSKLDLTYARLKGDIGFLESKKTALEKTLQDHRLLEERHTSLCRELEYENERRLKLEGSVESLKQTLENDRRELQEQQASSAQSEVYIRRLKLHSACEDAQLLSSLLDDLYSSMQAVLSSRRYRVGTKIVDGIGKKLLNIPNRNAAWAPEEAAEIHKTHELWKSQHPQRLRVSLRPEAPETESLTKSNMLVLCSKLEKETEQTLQDSQELAQWFKSLWSLFNAVMQSRRYKVGDLLVNKIAKRLVFARSHGAAWSPELASSLLVKFEVWENRNAKLGLNNIPIAPANDSFVSEQTIPSTKPKTTKENVRVTQFTTATPRNPYYSMIPNEMLRMGWNYQYSYDPALICQQLADKEFELEIIHLHQLEPYYHSKTGDREETSRRAKELIEHLSIFKQLGAKLVWTKHNPLPHNREFSDIDTFLIKVVMNLVDHVIVLGQHAKNCLMTYKEREEVSVISHPSFRSIYGPKLLKSEARQQLGLSIEDGTFLFGSVGEIKPYKGLERIIKCFNELSNKSKDTKAKLLIAGAASSEDYADELRALANDDVIFRIKLFKDEELPVLLSALDSSVFSFRDIWGSSSVVLSLSYEVPVIAPELGCIPDYVMSENTGFTYKAHDDAALIGAMQKALSTELLPHMRYMCDYFNDEYSVGNVGLQFEKLYLRVANG
jgi:glycosyltransferase involved in cell wall biosynthesis/flagellar motility protein MotE (MotC chaperone)